MSKLDPYQQFIQKGNETYKRLRLQFVDVDGSTCDSCNQKKKCAIIQDLTSVSHHICLECLTMLQAETSRVIFEYELNEALEDAQGNPKGSDIKDPAICGHGDENNDLCDDCLNDRDDCLNDSEL